MVELNKELIKKVLMDNLTNGIKIIHVKLHFDLPGINVFNFLSFISMIVDYEKYVT